MAYEYYNGLLQSYLPLLAEAGFSRDYGYQWFGIKPKVTSMFHAITDSGTKLGSYVDEAGARACAEDWARRNQGKTCYVAKAISKSYVAPAPAITTAL